MQLHPLAATGFGGADLYERGRPDYPPEAIAALDLPAGARVLDLAAGSGKLTRALRAAGFDVVPVEPQAVLRERLQGALAGTAEDIPLGGASVDAATIGDAWHWFDADRAGDELARVVRPGGLVAVLWQHPGSDQPDWAPALGEILLPLRRDHPGFRQRFVPLADHPAFDGPEERSVPFAYATDPERYLAFVASMSFVAVLGERERADVLRRVEQLIPSGPFTLPYATRLVISRRRA